MVPIHETKRTNTTGSQWGVNPLTSTKMTEKGAGAAGCYTIIHVHKNTIVITIC